MSNFAGKMNLTMKRLLVCLSLLLLVVGVMAIPARPDLWKTIRLADGTEVRARLVGDEHLHYWQAEDGQCYRQQGDCFVVADMAQMARQGTVSRARASRLRTARMQQRRSQGVAGGYLGKKKGLIILVQFSDVKFQSGHDQVLFNNIANTLGFTTSDGFCGSVYDYFKDQSYGQFELTFDVVGPVTMPKGYAYYGEDGDEEGDDLRKTILIK